MVLSEGPFLLQRIITRNAKASYKRRKSNLNSFRYRLHLGLIRQPSCTVSDSFSDYYEQFRGIMWRAPGPLKKGSWASGPRRGVLVRMFLPVPSFAFKKLEKLRNLKIPQWLMSLFVHTYL